MRFLIRKSREYTLMVDDPTITTEAEALAYADKADDSAWDFAESENEIDKETSL